MKRNSHTILFLLLAAIFLLMPGCGSKAAPSLPTQTIEAEETETQTIQETQPTLDIQILSPSITTNVLSGLDKDGNASVTVSYDTVDLDEKMQQYPQLYDALKQINQQTEEACNQRLEELLGEYNSWKTDFPDSPEASFSEEWKLSAVRTDSSIFSLRQDVFSFTGGVHGNYFSNGLNLDVNTGKKLVLSDLIPDRASLNQCIADQLTELYADRLYENTMVDEALNVYDSQDYCWVADDQGVRIFFNPYELAPYAAGLLEVFLPFDQHSDLFLTEYTNVPEHYILPLREGETALYQWDGNTKNLSYQEKYDDYGQMEAITVRMNEMEKDYPIYSYKTSAFFVKVPAGSFLYLFTLGDSDSQSLEIVNLATGETSSIPVGLYSRLDYQAQAEQTSSLQSQYTTCAFSDPERFLLQTRLDALSTLSGQKQYRIDTNGLPASEDDGYLIIPDMSFTAKKDLKSVISGENSLIASGTQLKYYATDGSTWAAFMLPDGKIARTSITTQWPQTISGLDLEEALEGTMFAG